MQQHDKVAFLFEFLLAVKMVRFIEGFCKTGFCLLKGRLVSVEVTLAFLIPLAVVTFTVVEPVVVDSLVVELGFALV